MSIVFLPFDMSRVQKEGKVKITVAQLMGPTVMKMQISMVWLVMLMLISLMMLIVMLMMITMLLKVLRLAILTYLSGMAYQLGNIYVHILETQRREG